MKDYFIAFKILTFGELIKFSLAKLSGQKNEYYHSIDKKIYVLKSKPLKIYGNPFSKSFELRFKLNNTEIKTSLRKLSSDFDVFNQVFHNEEYYETVESVKKHLKRNLETIVDAGANIGLATLYFHAHFSDAKYLAIEPFKENSEVLKGNVRRNGIDVSTFNKALYPTKSKMKIDRTFRDGLEWSIRLLPDPNGEIDTITIPECLDHFKNKRIDLFKIDIEGGEFPLITDTPDLEINLKKCNAIVLEIHDEMGDRTSLEEKILSCGFAKVDLGELTLFLNDNAV